MTSRLTKSGEFWNRPGLWPRDAPDGKFIFLARAVDIVGPAMFADEWHPGDTVQIRFARNDAEEKDNQSRWQRFTSVQNLIGSALARGELDFALRGHDGGAMKHAKMGNHSGRFGVDDWNVDNFFVYFSQCKMSDKAPGLDIGQDDWIFVNREQLEALTHESKNRTSPVAAVATSEVIPTDPKHLSPYLQLMLEVAREMKITPTNQPKHAVLVSVLLSKWGDLPESDRLVQAAATILREPGSQAGRAGNKEKG